MKITSTATTPVLPPPLRAIVKTLLKQRFNLRSLRRGLSLRRCLRHSHIDVDLSSLTAKQTATPTENRQHYHNHDNHQYGNHAGTAASATVVSHLNAPLREAVSGNSI